MWESMNWSGGQQMIAVVAATVAVVGLLVIIWKTSPTKIDDVARATTTTRQTPSSKPAAPTPGVAVQKPTADTPPEPIHPGSDGGEEFIDSPGVSAGSDRERFQDALTHFRLGRAAVDSSHWTIAIAEYGAAVRLAPDDAVAHYDFALALHRRGDERDAIASFRRAIALAPDDARFRLPLAAALENVGRSAEAELEYKAFLAAVHESSDADRARGRLAALSTGQGDATKNP
jgi:tetratricopeptide (TPR) repeat protein